MARCGSEVMETGEKVRGHLERIRMAMTVLEEVRKCPNAPITDFQPAEMNLKLTVCLQCVLGRYILYSKQIDLLFSFSPVQAHWVLVEQGPVSALL